MATAKISPGDHSNAKKLVCIYILVTHKRKKSRIPIKGLKITDGNWSEKKFIKEAEPTVINVGNTNEILKGYELKALQTINRLASDNQLYSITVEDLAKEISLACFNIASKQTLTFGTYTDTVIAELRLAQKHGTADCYEDVKNFVTRRMGRDILFPELTTKALEKMTTMHFADGKSVNGLSFYMRGIRAVYNRAVKDKLVTREHSPFNEYKIRNQKTKKRAISLADFISIKDLIIPEKSPKFWAQKYFLFSFYTSGMNFSDMAYIKVRDVSGDRLNYTRLKTGQLFSIKLLPQAKEILAYFTKNKQADEYVFPILKHADTREQRADIESVRRYYNRLLTKIAKSCGLEYNLTSYVSRHSWATLAKLSGVPIAMISEGMGHSDVKTTAIYLDSFPDEMMDLTRQAIANLLNKKPDPEK